MARELTIRLQTEQGIPLYRQIYNYVRDEIRSGSLEAGERLPSTRALAAGLHVARSTAELAYSQLLSEGYIRAKKNSGYFVNEIENLAELHFPDRGKNRYGTPDKGTVLFYGDKADPGNRRFSGADRIADDRINAENRIRAEREIFKADWDTDRTGPGPEIDFSLRHTEMSVFPYSTWKKIMREVMAGADLEIFSHSEPGGDLSLRTTIAHYLHFSRGVLCSPGQVVVGAGNDYLLMLLRHILGEGRRVAMEEVSYLRAAQIFHSFGYTLCPVRMDRDGMLPGSVLSSGADLVYAMPAHQFPVGCVMPVARRAALLTWAMEKPERYIIEDDYDSEFRYRGKPIPALQSLDHAGKVIYIGTFSKAIAPAIRISYMILPPGLLEVYHHNCYFFSSTVSRIDQRILNEFMKNGHFERHLNRMRSLYRIRHDELTARLKPFGSRFRILGGGTGLHLVLEALPETVGIICAVYGLKDREPRRIEQILRDRALEVDVCLYCLSDFRISFEDSGKPFHTGTPGTEETAFRRPALLLGFGALDEARIREGIRRLSLAWDFVLTEG